MQISFVILTWNSEQFIGPCVESIFEDVGKENSAFEIWIVDNGSTDRTPAVIREFAARYSRIIQPIFLEKNHGTTASRNLALKKATGETIVILDSDVRLQKGVTRGLLHTLYSAEDIGMAAPRLIYGDGRHQKSVDVFPTLIHKIKRFVWLKSIERSEEKAVFPNSPVEVDYAISALWAIRRRVLAQVGLLDEHIFYSPEDVDYCLRIWKAGLRVIYDPRCTAIHDAQEISRGFRISKAAFSHLLGLVYLFRKHGYFFCPPNHDRPTISRFTTTH